MSQDKEREALPCPFCGGKAHRRKETLDERFAYADRVSYGCAVCGFSLGARGDTSKGGYADNSTVEKRALAAWNTRAALASQQAVKGEPVAWALLTNGKPNAPRGRTLSWEPPCNESLQIAAIEGESWVPLFASPPSREPLTDEQIEQLLWAFDRDSSFPDIVRATERTHGIHSREGGSK